eukprot:COSAG02_NODE_4674_length_5106_cov_9.921310_5_plen_323_part_01
MAAPVPRPPSPGPPPINAGPGRPIKRQRRSDWAASACTGGAHGALRQVAPGLELPRLGMELRKYDFFINHCQASGQDQCKVLATQLRSQGVQVWLDMEAEDITEQGMQEAVSQSRNVLMFLSIGLAGREFCRKEQRWGKQYGCKFIGIKEDDDRHGRANFAEERAAAPDDLKHLYDEVEFISYRRREHEVRAMIAELMSRGGCTQLVRETRPEVMPSPAAINGVNGLVWSADGSANECAYTNRSADAICFPWSQLGQLPTCRPTINGVLRIEENQESWKSVRVIALSAYGEVTLAEKVLPVNDMSVRYARTGEYVAIKRMSKA